MSLRRIVTASTLAVLSASIVSAPSFATANCETPTLVNGSFEDYPIDPTPTDMEGEISAIGAWMNDWGTPQQFLFLDQDESDQILPGWETTNSENLVELQRQVEGFEQDGTDTSDGYFDNSAVQPADGDVWGELNATEDAALYQDIELQAGVEYTWSIKHHGRVFSADGTDEMGVKIGPANGALVDQTDLLKFTPTNADLFVGEPTYGSEGVPATQIRDSMADGWVKYQGTYTPETDGTYRFSFYAIDGWDLSVGNLIDDVEFAPTACLSDNLASTGVSDSTTAGFFTFGIVAALAGAVATRRGARAARR